MKKQKKPFVLSFQSVVSYLRFLNLVMANLDLVDCAVKPIQSVISTKQSTVFLTVSAKLC